MRRVDTPGYESWHAMKQRCRANRPDYKKYYGDKNISYDPRWESFDNFIEDMGLRPSDKHSLDRIDNNKGYYKENCRWATPMQQMRNRGLQSNNQTGHRGVKIRRDYKVPKYFAQITINRKKINLGTYSNLKDAIEARKRAELLYW